ncbi:type II toxin-antitoxin system VapC family toxin [Candidatus Sumerlaeota bacterium]|nr:type II toxin-antitoxin system VapC family toxin [Candidatus Sumerlaeota bacterium]
MADILLDTNVMIDFLRGHPSAIRFLSEREHTDRLLCSIVSVFELHQGCRNADEQARLDRFLASFTVVPIEHDDSLTALEWFRRWRLSHGIAMLDCLIGAAAYRLRIAFFTRDQDHFSLFPGLDLRAPY